MNNKKQTFTLLNKKFFEFLKETDTNKENNYNHVVDLFAENPTLKSKGFKKYIGNLHEPTSGYLNETIDETTKECTSLRVSNHLPELKNLVTMNKTGVPTRRPYGNICLLFFGSKDIDVYAVGSEKGNYCFTKKRKCILLEGKSDIKRIEDYYKTGDIIPYYAYVFVPNFTTDEDVHKLIDASLNWIHGKGNSQYIVPELSNEYAAPLAKPIYCEAVFRIKPHENNEHTNESVTVVSGTGDIVSIPLGDIRYTCEEDDNIMLDIDVTLNVKECPEIFIDWVIEHANMMKHSRLIYDFKDSPAIRRKKK